MRAQNARTLISIFTRIAPGSSGLTRMTLAFSAAALILLPLQAGFAADPFNYFVELKKFHPGIYGEKTTRYRLISSDEGFTLIQTPHQNVINASSVDGKKTIEIRCGLLGSKPKKEKDLSAFLPDTRFLNLAAPEISGAAAKLDRADPIRSVENFVYNHIADKFTGMPLVPALHVYRMKRGDCTEHTVLSVALLRSMKVPARAVVGMYLIDEFKGRRDVFAYHMWAEAYHNGKWEVVDATRPGKKSLNRYIAFAYHNLKTEAPLAYLRAISSIQDLTAEYIGR